MFGFENLPSTEQRRTAFNDAMRVLSAAAATRSRPCCSCRTTCRTAGFPDVLAVYTDLLDDAGYAYDVKTVPTGRSGPSLDELTGYDIVIWFTGFGNSSSRRSMPTTDRLPKRRRSLAVDRSGLLVPIRRIRRSCATRCISTSFVSRIPDNESWSYRIRRRRHDL